MANRIMEIRIEDLEPDPLNEEAYSESDIEGLSSCMKNIGFFGTIAAYPIENNKYRIESGHRRFEAAKKAGLEILDVEITEPPVDEIERRKRLTQWNLHNRQTDNPMVMAQVAKFLFDTYEMENKKKKENGLQTEAILPRVAEDLDSSTSNITKYKMLLSLIPELQDLVKTGDYSWASLAKASVLERDQQEYLYRRIKGQTRLLGPTAAPGSWIESEISDLKHMRFISADSYKYDPNSNIGLFNTEEPAPDQEIVRRKRRCDGFKNMKKSIEYLKIASNKENLIKKKDQKRCLDIISDMRKELDLIESRLK